MFRQDSASLIFTAHAARSSGRRLCGDRRRLTSVPRDASRGGLDRSELRHRNLCLPATRETRTSLFGMTTSTTVARLRTGRPGNRAGSLGFLQDLTQRLASHLPGKRWCRFAATAPVASAAASESATSASKSGDGARGRRPSRCDPLVSQTDCSASDCLNHHVMVRPTCLNDARGLLADGERH